MTTIQDKKLKLIYNPYSGDHSFKHKLHDCVSLMQERGYEVHLFRTMERGDIASHIAGLPRDYYDAVALSGGDGTLSIAIDALQRHGHDLPILLLPSGTANDFASALGIPKNLEEAVALLGNEPRRCDAGTVNGRYFLNVCAAGFLADISQAADPGLKNTVGNVAYYLTLLGRLPGLSPLRVRIANTSGSFEEDIYLFMALNSSGIGGFKGLSPGADLSDGLFEFLAVKAAPLADLAMVFVRLLQGEHLSDPNIIFFRDSRCSVEVLSATGDNASTDVDGESGPILPITVENRRHALRIFKPQA